MKKVLYGSTALLAVAMFAGAASAADPVKLGVGGHMKNWLAYADQDGSFETANSVKYNNTFTVSDTEIYFTGSTTLDNGLQVGAMAQLEASRSLSRFGDEAFMWVSSAALGRIELGEVQNIAHKVHNRAPSVGFSFDGTSGSHSSLIVAPTGMVNTNKTGADIGKGGKIQYISPSFGGLQVVAGWTPSDVMPQGAGGSSNGIINKTNDRDGLDAGVAYNGTLGGVGVKADLVYNQYSGGETFAGAYQSLGRKSWQAGLGLTYAGFTFGASYANFDDKDENPAGGTNSWEGNAWDAGVSYASGPFGVSVAYFQSKHDAAYGASRTAGMGEDEVKAWEVAGAYTMGPGIAWRTSVMHADYETYNAAASNANKNDGWGVVSGLDIRF